MFAESTMNRQDDEFANLYEVDDRPIHNRRPSHKQLQSMLPPDIDMPKILGKIDRVTELKRRDSAEQNSPGESSSDPREEEDKYAYCSSTNSISKEDCAIYRKLDRPTPDSRNKSSYERNLRRYYHDNRQFEDSKRSYISRDQPPFDDPFRSDWPDRATSQPVNNPFDSQVHYAKQPPGAYSYEGSTSGHSSDPVGEEGMTIEISPGVLRPLRGAQETVSAMQNGTYTVVCCLVCEINLFCVEDCEMVVCPDCKVISPNTASLGSPRGVGLGLKA